MTELGIALIGLVSIGAILVDMKRPGGCLRYSFLCGALYLTWVIPQLAALSVDYATPQDGLFWLVIMAVLGLVASLIGWRAGGAKQPSVAALASIRAGDTRKLFGPVAALTGFIYLLHILIGMQSTEALQQGQWSGPLTIIAFFLNLSATSLYLSLLLAFRERNARAFILAGANIVLTGSMAFVGVRRGTLIDFGIAAIATLWFGAHKRVPSAAIALGMVGMVAVTYATGPLRSAAVEVAQRTGSSVGLLSPDVWKQVDFASEIEIAARLAPDFANAVRIIDHANQSGEFTFGRQSWDALVFQWVPAQLLSADFKSSLMFRQGMDWEQVQASYGYTTIFGTTTTGFGFAYQEFGPVGSLYFLLIGLLMGRLWPRAQAGDVWAQALYVSFAGLALQSVTHHAMWLIVKIPLFLLAVYVLKRATGTRVRHRRHVDGNTLVRP